MCLYNLQQMELHRPTCFVTEMIQSEHYGPSETKHSKLCHAGRKYVVGRTFVGHYRQYVVELTCKQLTLWNAWTDM